VKSLILLFHEVKRTFYPRWDPNNEWTIQRRTRLSEGYNVNAMCNRKTKTIEISRRFIAQDDNDLPWLLVHEICHAVAKGNHGKIWQTRFLKVADRAELLGQQPLAGKIRADVDLLQNAPKPTVRRIRHSIEDALMDQPGASYEIVIEWVANNWGYTANGLLRKHPSLKKHFDKTKRDALMYRDLWEKYRTDRLR